MEIFLDFAQKMKKPATRASTRAAAIVLSGLGTSPKLAWVYLRGGGDPAPWSDLECMERDVSQSDRVFHKMRTYVLCDHTMGTAISSHRAAWWKSSSPGESNRSVKRTTRGQTGRPTIPLQIKSCLWRLEKDRVVKAMKEFVVAKARQKNAFEVAATRGMPKASSFGDWKKVEDGGDGDEGTGAGAAQQRPQRGV